MCKNDGLEIISKKKKKIHIQEALSHLRECGSRAAFPGGSEMIWEGSHVWSPKSNHFMCAQWVAKDLSFLHVDSEDSDQTGQMPRLT